MNEHEPQIPAMEVRPASEQAEPDWRRLEVAAARFGQRISEGISMALAAHTEIDDNTARCIAHVLGRAYGRESALADFGRTAEGNYVTLRDEYLHLYGSEQAGPGTKELIDWFGTYLLQRENTGSGRQFMNEHQPPQLKQLLVRTSVRVGDDRHVINVPADWDSSEMDGLIETLTLLQLSEDTGLQAFLSLPDVSAGVDDIMESFHEAFAGTYGDEVEALRALSPLEDWENELADWCIDRGVDFEVLEWNYEPLIERLRLIYDLVEKRGHIYAFVK